MGEYKELPTGTNEILNKARRLLVARSGKSPGRPHPAGRAQLAKVCAEPKTAGIRPAGRVRAPAPTWFLVSTRRTGFSYGFRCIDSLGWTEHFRGQLRLPQKSLNLAAERAARPIQARFQTGYLQKAGRHDLN
jgi:hypothetical protein